MKSTLFRTARAVALSVPFVVGAPPVIAQEAAIISVNDRFTPIRAQSGMVSSQNAESSQIGVEILQAGGNAIDAAIAVGFSLAVTLPKAGNIGGGFMVYFDNANDDAHSINFRDEAPAAAHRDLHLGADGEVDKAKTRGNGLSVAVPGTVAGLAKAYEEFGSGNLSWAELIAPALRQAEEGFVVNNDRQVSSASLKKRLSKDPEAIEIFYSGSDIVPELGDRVPQPDLAESLRRIAEEGRDGFYHGPIAQAIVDTQMPMTACCRWTISRATKPA